MRATQPSMARPLLAATFFVLTIPTAAAAPGEWTVGRHDGARTGIADLPSAFTSPPVATWRQYVGGSLRQYVMRDLDGDGAEDLINLAGGVVYRKTADNQIVWKKQLPAEQLYGPMDLDGNGALEVLAVQATPVRISVLSVDDGALLYQFKDSAEIGTVGAIRIHDLNLDGIQDLIVEECHCCTYNSGKPGFAMRFDQGFSAPARMYSIGADCGSSSDFFASLDGTNQQYWEIGYNNIKGTDTKTGSVTYNLATDRLRSNSTRIEPVDLDRDGDQELVYLNYYQVASDGGVPRFGVYDLDRTTGQLKILWERKLPDAVNDHIEAGVRWIDDLDGDGKYELAISIYTASLGIWTFRVVDALTGADLSQLADQRAASIIRMGPSSGATPGAPRLVTYNTTQDRIYAWSWAKSGLSPLWEYASATLASERSRIDGSTTPWSDVVLIDYDQDGAVELPLYEIDKNRRIVNLALVDPLTEVNDLPALLARTSVPSGLNLERVIRCDGFDTYDPALCVVRTDGYLQVLDDTFTVVNQDGPEPAFLPGMQLGGYLPYDSLGSYPLVSRLGKDDPPLVWTPNSQGYYVALDVADASLYVPAVTELSMVSKAPVTVADLDKDGNREILFIDSDRSLHCRRSDGVTDAWTARLAPSDASFPFGIVTGDANGDGTLDVFYTWSDSSATAWVIPVNGANGVALWLTPFKVPYDWGAYPFAVGDVDADGDADVAVTWDTFFVIDGKTGSTLISDNIFRAYGVGTLYNTDSDAQLEIIQQSGYYPDRLLDPNFSTKTTTVTWDDGQMLRTGQQGAVVTCSSTDVRFVKGYAADNRFQVYNLKTGALIADWRAAQGKLYINADAQSQAGAEGGSLTHMITSPDLTNTVTPGVLFASSDGYLYAFNACGSASTLLWTVNFGMHLGAPVLADIDLDGLNEILIHAGDGYLYHLDRQPTLAPAEVLDLDSAAGTADVDAFTTIDTLYAGWSTVTDALSYEVGVLSAANAYITEPSFLPASGSSTTISGLELCNGATYRVAVRAVGPNGRSVETLSDGVKLTVQERCDGLDNNCDGRADETFDADGDGSVSCVTSKPADCNDNDASTYPGASEKCDGKDNDCDGAIDENAVDAVVYYGDTDKDGYGNPDYDKAACSIPKNFVTNDDDCDDTDKNTYPGATELCDEADNDCDGSIDEGVSSTYYVDADGDGYGSSSATTQACATPGGYSSNSLDCDDADASIRPGQNELCDEIDNDCDGQVDEGVTSKWYVDADLDGYGDPSNMTEACSAVEGTVGNGLDCDDGSAAAYPGAPEVCGDGVDQDCNGYDLGCSDIDDDGDGITDLEGDCDDTDPEVNPAEEEIPYDGIDQDCNGADLTDVDLDGYDATEAGAGGPDPSDCDDLNSGNYPGAPEVCDGEDNDCNAVIDDKDADIDGYISQDCGGDDCDDQDPQINPGEAEIDDDIDQDCDDTVDEGTDGFDDDDDGYTEDQGDCDDADPGSNPGEDEVPDDGTDNDCDGETDEEETPTPEPSETPGPDDTPGGTEVPDSPTPDGTPGGTDEPTSPTPGGTEEPGSPTPTPDDGGPDETPTPAASPSGDGTDSGEGCACSQPSSSSPAVPRLGGTLVALAGLTLLARRRRP